MLQISLSHLYLPLCNSVNFRVLLWFSTEQIPHQIVFIPLSYSMTLNFHYWTDAQRATHATLLREK